MSSKTGEMPNHPASQQPQNGLVDNVSRRDDSDALEGHFVNIDVQNADVKKALKDAGVDTIEGSFGVFTEPATRDPKDGFPVKVMVRLRGASNALLTLPYEALSPAEARGR